MLTLAFFTCVEGNTFVAERSDLHQFEPLQNLIRVKDMKPFAYQTTERNSEGEIVKWTFVNVKAETIVLYND